MKKAKCPRGCVPGSSKLSGTPAEHAVDFQNARHDALSYAQEANQAMAAGQCLAAGSSIDRGYEALGRMDANTVDADTFRETARVREALHAADAPFETRCVRPEPVTLKQGLVSHPRAFHGLGAGVSSDGLAFTPDNPEVGRWQGTRWTEFPASELVLELSSTGIRARFRDEQHFAVTAFPPAHPSVERIGAQVFLTVLGRTADFRIWLDEDDSAAFMIWHDQLQEQGFKVPPIINLS